MFWYYGATLFSIGTKTITISMALNICFFCLYFVKGNVKTYPKRKLPYAVPMMLVVLSYFFSCLFSVGGFLPEFTRTISTLSYEILIAWLVWYIVDTEKDFEFLFKGITIIMFIACVYGMAEYLIGSNFVITIKNSVANSEIVTYNTIQSATAQSRGYRITSIFEHSIGAGMNYALYAVTVLYLYINKRLRLGRNILAVVTAVLCVPCLMLTKMRSSMLFALIVLLSCLDFKKKNFYKFAGITVLIAIIALPYCKSYIELFLSLFSSKFQSGVRGSNVEQRLTQLEAAYHLMLMSPLGGLGSLVKDNLVNSYTKALLNYESVWFGEMVMRGMFGVVANILLMIYSVILIPRRYKCPFLFFLSGAYWLTFTLTSVPSFRMHMYYLVLFYFIKASKVYSNMAPEKYRFLKFNIKL